MQAMHAEPPSSCSSPCIIICACDSSYCTRVLIGVREYDLRFYADLRCFSLCSTRVKFTFVARGRA